MAKKWTMAGIKKMSKQEIQNIIDRAQGVHTVCSGASKQELINQLIMLINNGKI